MGSKWVYDWIGDTAPPDQQEIATGMTLSVRATAMLAAHMKKFVAIAPSSTMSFCTLGIGVTPLLNGEIGKLPPSSWSWSSVLHHGHNL
jgi:hypothetical protein